MTDNNENCDNMKSSELKKAIGAISNLFQETKFIISGVGMLITSIFWIFYFFNILPITSKWIITVISVLLLLLNIILLVAKEYEARKVICEIKKEISVLDSLNKDILKEKIDDIVKIIPNFWFMKKVKDYAKNLEKIIDETPIDTVDIFIDFIGYLIKNLFWIENLYLFLGSFMFIVGAININNILGLLIYTLASYSIPIIILIFIGITVKYLYFSINKKKQPEFVENFMKKNKISLIFYITFTLIIPYIIMMFFNPSRSGIFMYIINIFYMIILTLITCITLLVAIYPGIIFTETMGVKVVKKFIEKIYFIVKN